MKVNELRQLDAKKLQKELSLATLQYQKLMSEKALMKLKDTSQLAKTRKRIAQLMTVVTEKAQLQALASDTATKEEEQS